MAELALNDVERDAFARHLHRVRMAKLVRREASSDACLSGRAGETHCEPRQLTRVDPG